MKKLIIFIIVLFIISSVSATVLLLHPPKIEFSGNSNEKICQTVSVFSDYKGNLIAKIKWADKKDSKNLNDYLLNSSNLAITNDFSEKVISNNKMEEVKICLTFEKSGEYYGALLYNTETSPAGVGIWIYANIKGNGNGLDLAKITGNAISGLKNIINLGNILGNSKTQRALAVSSTTILLFILFMLLLSIEKRIKREDEEENTPNKIIAEEKIKKKPTRK